jgi:hypothetical protein
MPFVGDYIAAFAASPLARFGKWNPWKLTANASGTIDRLLAEIGGSMQGRGECRHSARRDHRAG